MSCFELKSSKELRIFGYNKNVKNFMLSDLFRASNDILDNGSDDLNEPRPLMAPWTQIVLSYN